MKTRGRPAGKTNSQTIPGTVGHFIQSARLRKGLGLSQAVQNTNFTVQFLSNIEHGRAPLPMTAVKNLSETLSVNVKTLAKKALESTDSFKQYQALINE